MAEPRSVRPSSPLRLLGAVVLLVAGVSLALGGAAVLAVALAAGSGAGQQSELVPLEAGEAVPLPDAGAFGGTYVVYGEASPDPLPGEDDLGCRLLDASGSETPFQPTVVNALEEDEVERDGTVLRPLVGVSTIGEGTQVRCDGPEAATAVALGVGAGAAGTIAGVGVVLGPVFLLVGVVVVVLGVLLLRSTRR